MRNNQTIKGSGTVTSNSGEHAKVKYEIQIEKNVIHGAPDLSSGPSDVPGLPTITGRISPACFFGTQALTLTLKDGQTARFIYLNSSGDIHVNWIGRE
jgi:hypothetical protein